MITNRFDRTSSTLGSILTGVLACVVLVAVAGLAVAQNPSTDRDNPTQLTAGEIKSDGVDEKTEYFYTFNAGPGEITLTLDVKAEKDTAVSSVDIALFDAKSKKLMSTYANPDHGSSKRAVETVKVRGTQPLLLEVTVSHGVDTFKIKLDGAVEFAQPVQAQPDQTQPANTATPEPTPTPTPQADMATGQTDAQSTADAQPATNDAASGPVTSATDASAQSNTTDAAPVNSATPTNSPKSRAQKVQSAINSASSTSGSFIGMISSTKESLKGMKASTKGNSAGSVTPATDQAAVANADSPAAADATSQSDQDNSSVAPTTTDAQPQQRPASPTSLRVSSTNVATTTRLPMRPSSPQASTNHLPLRSAGLPAQNNSALPNRVGAVQSQSSNAPRNIQLQSRPASQPKANPNFNNSTATTAESRMVAPHITVRSERVSAPKRVGYVINVTNWNEFKFNKFVIDKTRPQILPPSPCDQSKGVRFVAQLHTDDGANSVCHNLSTPTDLMEIRTTAPTGTSLKGFYLVITDLQSGRSVKSNIAAISAK